MVDLWENVDDTVWNAKELSEFVNENDVCMFQEFMKTQLRESVDLCEKIMKKAVYDYPTKVTSIHNFKDMFESFIGKFDDMLCTKDDRELTDTEKENLQKLKSNLKDNVIPLMRGWILEIKTERS